MQSSSRRAFLRGRQLPSTPWGRFCQQVRSSLDGEFIELNKPDSAGLARLTAQHTADVHRLRILCQDHDVALALDGVALPRRTYDQATVRVAPGRSLGRLEPLQNDMQRWFVQPGCTLGQLVDVGLNAFASLPATMTVGAWLADRTLADFAVGHTAGSGIELAQVLLADGSTVTLGPFGAGNTRPLENERARQLISALFRLAGDPSARSWQGADWWPGRYRLDALMPADGQPNLAHLLLGHGGDLCWVQWVVLNTATLDPASGLTSQYSTELVSLEGWQPAADALDQQIKKLFDPDALFSSMGQDL